MKSARGSTKIWTAHVLDGATQPQDPEELILTVYDPQNNVVDGFPVSLGVMTRESQGHYHYDWPIPPTADLGSYRGAWTGTLNGGPIEGEEVIEVVVEGFVEIPGLVETTGAYMTPQRLKTMAIGANFARLSDYELLSYCIDATMAINAYCNQPLLPAPGSFLGGHAVDEEHSWRFPASSLDRGTRRIYLNHWPIISVDGLQIIVGNGAAAAIPPESLVVNNALRYVEVTALTIATPSGLFGTTGWVVPLGGLTVPISKTSYVYGWALPIVNEITMPIDPGGAVYQPAHGWWTEDAVSVSLNGNVVDQSEYTIDRVEGRVTFNTPPTGIVTVSYTHRLPFEISRAAAVAAADFLADADIRRRGLAGLASARINEIEVRRQLPRTMSPNTGEIDLQAISPRAAALLGGFRYWAVA